MSVELDTVRRRANLALALSVTVAAAIVVGWLVVMFGWAA